MDIKSLVLDKISNNKQIKTSEIIKLTGFSRTYINRALHELRDEGKIIMMGKANKSVYVLAEKKSIDNAKKQILKFSENFTNENLSEESVLKKIQDETGILMELTKNIDNIIVYSFLEMVNNAIDHSQSKNIQVKVEKNETDVSFIVKDFGIGIFNNIKSTFGLVDNLSAIQWLLKGKQTTAPEAHTGQGIFFSSKMADSFIIKSSGKKVQFLNKEDLNDIYIENIKEEVGTEIFFIISLKSHKTAQEIFEKFTDKNTFEFSKTKILVKLFEISKNPLSRSEARRVMLGLNEFKEITLDFNNVESIGQSFADEIFRVWQNNHSDIKINYINAVENVEFMIKRAI